MDILSKFNFEGRRAEDAARMSLADFIAPLLNDSEAGAIEALIEIVRKDGSTSLVKLEASLLAGRGRIRA